MWSGSGTGPPHPQAAPGQQGEGGAGSWLLFRGTGQEPGPQGPQRMASSAAGFWNLPREELPQRGRGLFWVTQPLLEGPVRGRGSWEALQTGWQVVRWPSGLVSLMAQSGWAPGGTHHAECSLVPGAQALVLPLPLLKWEG